MKPRQQLTLAGVLLVIGALAALAAGKPPRAEAGAAGPEPAGAVAEAPGRPRSPEQGCPRGQLDAFGVCVPVAQTPPSPHSAPEAK